MAVDLAERLKVRQQARFHVQVRLETVPAAGTTPGEVPVEGRVTRLFRSDGGLALDDRVTFSVHVCRQGEQTPPGPAYLLYDDLCRATHMEAYLNGTPPRCQIALDECAILAGPRADPIMTVAELEAMTIAGTRMAWPSAGRKWWRPWRA